LEETLQNLAGHLTISNIQDLRLNAINEKEILFQMLSGIE